MTPEILSVDEATSLQELATYLVEHEVTGVVVTGEDGTPIGVVSSTDIAAAAANAGDSLEDRASRRGFYDEGGSDTFDDSDLVGIRVDDEDLTAGDIMTPEIFSVTVETPISEVARLLVDSHIHRLLVTENDEFVGIITTSDLLGLLVEEPA